MKRLHSLFLSLLLLVGVMGLPACQKQDEAPESAQSAPAMQPRSGPPVLEELQNMTFRGLEGLEPVTLRDGLWEGPPAAEGGASRPVVRLLDEILLQGDLDADGREEVVAFLDLATGGTGQLLYVAVVERVEGQPRNVATTRVGDRVQIRDARIESNKIVLDVVQAGPEDALCCPGELATRAWTFHDEKGLQPLGPSGPTGRLRLETIAGTEWVLRFWEWGVPAPVEPEVTLRLDEGRLAGTNGCNNYFTSVAAGKSPGDLTVGPVGAQRMACPGAASAVESRFMQQLAGVKKFGFMVGHLALTYEVDGRIGVMLFEPRHGEPPDASEAEGS